MSARGPHGVGIRRRALPLPWRTHPPQPCCEPRPSACFCRVLSNTRPDPAPPRIEVGTMRLDRRCCHISKPARRPVYAIKPGGRGVRVPSLPPHFVASPRAYLRVLAWLRRPSLADVTVPYNAQRSARKCEVRAEEQPSFGHSGLRRPHRGPVPSGSSHGPAPCHDLLHIVFDYSTRRWRVCSARVRAERGSRVGPVGMPRRGAIRGWAAVLVLDGDLLTGVAISRSQAQTRHRAARLTSSRLRRASCFAAASSSGTPAPVPKYISSGVWPRNAEWGRRVLCSST